MTKDEKIDIVDKVCVLYKQQEKVVDTLISMGFDIDSKIIKDCFSVSDNMINSFSDIIYNDNPEDQTWLEWYVYENKCGERNLTAGFKDQSYTIKDAKDLINFLEITPSL